MGGRRPRGFKKCLLITGVWLVPGWIREAVEHVQRWLLRMGTKVGRLR